MTTQDKPSLRTALLTVLLGVCLAAAIMMFTEPSSSAEGSMEAEFDLTRPAPREKVLTLLAELFALPAEDHLNWDQAVEAGKIPPDVQTLHEHMMAQADEVDHEGISVEDLPTIELSDGTTLYPILKEMLGPNVGANVSQEDLNELLPVLADMQERVGELNEQQDDGPSFIPVVLEPGAFAISKIHDTATTDTVEVTLTQGENSDILHAEQPPALDGRHIQGIHVSTDHPVSVRVQLTEEGRESLARLTEESVGKTVAVLIDGEAHAAVAIATQIITDSLELPGDLTREDAEAILERWAGTAP